MYSHWRTVPITRIKQAQWRGIVLNNRRLGESVYLDRSRAFILLHIIKLYNFKTCRSIDNAVKIVTMISKACKTNEEDSICSSVGHKRAAARATNRRTRERELKRMRGTRAARRRRWLTHNQTHERSVREDVLNPPPWSKTKLKAASSIYNSGRKEKVDTLRIKHTVSERINWGSTEIFAVEEKNCWKPTTTTTTTTTTAATVRSRTSLTHTQRKTQKSAERARIQQHFRRGTESPLKAPPRFAGTPRNTFPMPPAEKKQAGPINTHLARSQKGWGSTRWDRGPGSNRATASLYRFTLPRA